MRIIMRTMFYAVAKPIISGIELCRANALTALPTDHAIKIDDMRPTEVSQIPRWDYSLAGISLSTNANPSTDFQSRPRSPLNISSHCSETHTRSRLCVDDTDTSENVTPQIISVSLNAALSTNSDIRNRPTSINSSHCSERHNIAFKESG